MRNDCNQRDFNFSEVSFSIFSLKCFATMVGRCRRTQQAMMMVREQAILISRYCNANKLQRGCLSCLPRFSAARAIFMNNVSWSDVLPLAGVPSDNYWYGIMLSRGRVSIVLHAVTFHEQRSIWMRLKNSNVGPSIVICSQRTRVTIHVGHSIQNIARKNETAMTRFAKFRESTCSWKVSWNITKSFYFLGGNK